MKQPGTALVRTALFSILLLLSGCYGNALYRPGPGYGPPPHAPAHGYRSHYHGHDLVYDSRLGVYAVVGLANVYFYDGVYYRFDHNRWYYTRELDKGWNTHRGGRGLPPGLAKKYGKDRRR